MEIQLKDCLFRKLPGLRWTTRCLVRLTVLIGKPLVSIRNGFRLSQIKGPVLYVFNHNSSFEAILMPAYLIFLCGGKRIGFIIDWMFGHLPVLGWLMGHVDPIYVFNKRAKLPFMNRIKDRQEKDPVYLRCLHRLSEGRSLGLFPEGKRNRNAEMLMPARKGIGEIILGSTVPIVPIGIDFPYRQKKRHIPRFGRMLLNVGKQMDFEFERTCKQWIERDSTLTVYEKRTLLCRIRSRVIHKTMLALSELSGKSYPYPESLNPILKGPAQGLGKKEDLCPV